MLARSALEVTTPPPIPPMLRRLLSTGILAPADWERLDDAVREPLLRAPDDDSLLTGLIGAGLLTPYQLGRLRLGEIYSLMLGNYRILEKIGAGGMGVVFRAEHVKFRQAVAVKALFLPVEQNRKALDRFFREVQAVTQLKHPHIVAAIDAGEQSGAGPQGAPVPYLVMEYAPGTNLEDLIVNDLPLPVEIACLIAHQLADALSEAHRNDVIHRDVKPGNVIVAADGTAKLLDFGIARLPLGEERLTQYGVPLGTIGYMAPEQVRNARDVDARADVFGLGATLYFMLTGRDPFDPPAGSAGAVRPPSPRDRRGDVSPALDALVLKLMALDPDLRVPSAEQAMRDLIPFLPQFTKRDARCAPPTPEVEVTPAPASQHRILIVDDQADIRRVCKLSLASDNARCDEAGTGPDAVDRLERETYDLVLLDVDLPGLSGELVLKAARRLSTAPNMKILMFSGRTSGDDLARMMLAGADDFLTKPFSVVQLRARVRAALKLKDAQDRSEILNRHLMTLNAELEANVSSRDGELIIARGAMVLAMAKLVEQRSSETGEHLLRLQRFVRILADAAARTPGYASRLDAAFIQALEDAAPLHDIGKVSIPDAVLNKPGRLDANERLLMEAHTTAGADTLAEVARRYKFATGFLHMAGDIARHHHERWDGSGYPDRLSGEEIPLAARLIAICDVYDALRAKRVYKPALSHNMAVMTITEASPGHFDPGLLAIFRVCADPFDRVYRELTD